MNLQVLLCGTGYGQAYLPVIFEAGGFQLGAILARGGDRSVRLSEQCGVNLYSQVSHINEPIDLACVAIGESTGTSIAVELLEKGIPVLIEHPVCEDNIRTLLRCAKENRTHCHINSHFPEIYPIVNFIALCQKLTIKSKPKIVSISCNSRTLFSTLDILMRALGEFSIGDFRLVPIAQNNAYLTITFSFNGTPCSLLYQKWRGVNDDSKDSPLGHQITVTYPEGVLCLNNTFGPCLWLPLAAGGIARHIPLYSQVNDKPVTLEDMFRWRKEANHQALEDLRSAHLHEEISHIFQRDVYLEHLCHTWTTLHSQLGGCKTTPTIDQIDKVFWTPQSLLEE